MERKAVKSSQIKSVGYDEMEETLEVEFSTNGSIYQYTGVPKHVYEEMMASDSVGKYFSKNIKSSFDSEKISG